MLKSKYKNLSRVSKARFFLVFFVDFDVGSHGLRSRFRYSLNLCRTHPIVSSLCVHSFPLLQAKPEYAYQI